MEYEEFKCHECYEKILAGVISVQIEYKSAGNVIVSYFFNIVNALVGAIYSLIITHCWIILGCIIVLLLFCFFFDLMFFDNCAYCSIAKERECLLKFKLSWYFGPIYSWFVVFFDHSSSMYVEMIQI